MNFSFMLGKQVIKRCCKNNGVAWCKSGLAVSLAALILSGCQSVNRNASVSFPSTPNDSVVKIPAVYDSGPKKPLNVDHIPNPLPVVEPRTRWGNKSPYVVDNKTYYVQTNIKGFEQSGDASWYGQKFHGQKTSNGELYNMFGMTAAHKTLPIPCFVEITNLSNNKKIIVRVNDRGPFHSDRIIDLSYTAARKLGYAEIGTARVTLKVIEPDPRAIYAGLAAKTPEQIMTPSSLIAPMPRNPGGYEIPEGTFLQLAAFGDAGRAKIFQQQMITSQLSSYPITIEHAPNREVYRVLLGPIKDNWDLVRLQISITNKGYQEPKVTYRQP